MLWTLLMFCTVFGNDATRSPVLEDIHYRYRGSFAVKLPGTIRIRIRPSYELRYKVKKKKFALPNENMPDKTEPNEIEADQLAVDTY